MSLESLKQGDTVIIEEGVNGRPVTIDAVGKKYITIGRMQFNRTDGRRHGENYGAQKTLYTVERWERVSRERAFCSAVNRLANIAQRAQISALNDADLLTNTHDLNRMIAQLESK